MNTISGSVGQGGANLREDVRRVQGLLNRSDLAPLAPLAEDGRSGPATIGAIRHFQVRHVGMASPDGRVDPGGRTWRKLRAAPRRPGPGENAETRHADRRARGEKVDPRVKETEATRRIIDALVPRLADVRARVIAGFLSDSDQFWKVNYHWEYLLGMVEHALGLPSEERHKGKLREIRSGLLGCAPRPASGYTSGPVGRPQDKSSVEEASRRHRMLAGAKRSFAAVTREAQLKRKSRRSARAFDLAAAPVAPPGTSKHGKGYALDIEGDNGAIKSLCRGLGATLVFDEKSHVHVEFRNGVGS